MRVLVVDDQPLFIALIRDALAPLGYKLTPAPSALRCLKLLEAEKYDLIILDRWLGQDDGLNLLRTIHSRGELRDVPIILQTSSSSPAAMREGIEAGAFYYLTKPYAAEVLVAVVQAALADAGRVQDLRAQIRDAHQAGRLLQSATLEFSTLEEAELSSKLLARAFPDAARVITGLTELTVNAIEHGNLELTYQDKSELLPTGRWHQVIHERGQDPRWSARKVRVVLGTMPSRTWVRITDEGPGFDWTRYLDFDPARAAHPHGRGIALARMVSFDDLRFLGRGNEVEAGVRR